MKLTEPERKIINRWRLVPVGAKLVSVKGEAASLRALNIVDPPAFRRDPKAKLDSGWSLGS